MRKWVIAMPLLFAAGSGTGQAPQMGEADRCTAMAQGQLRAGVSITRAELIAASAATPGNLQQGVDPLPPLPAYCRVTGTLDAHKGTDGRQYGIGFELALPLEWNGRFLLQGGGGLNGSVRPAIGPVASGTSPALGRGFAVISHDSGHRGAVFDNAFMSNQRAALDFAESSVRTVTVVGKALTERFYSKPIHHSYMTGCSTGGREGMLAIQRYPEMFDGVVVGAPAMRTGHSNLGIEYSNVQFNQAAPRDAAGLPLVERIFSPADRQTILSGLLKQCDALDGRADGMIMNVAQCHFRPAQLQCKAGEAANCLSGAQVQAMERAFAGPVNAAGYAAYAPVPYDTGIIDTAGRIPGYLPTGAPGVFGPATRALTIDIDARLRALAMDGPQRLTDTDVWTDLDTFLGKGSKVLFFHGVSDPWFSAWDSWDWWQRAAQANGQSFTDASRYYMIPGMAHCSGGNAFDNFDLLGPLVDWVEQGKAPERPTASRADGSAERPLCPHPSYAHYAGGDPAKAESYSCKAPTG